MINFFPGTSTQFTAAAASLAFHQNRFSPSLALDVDPLRHNFIISFNIDKAHSLPSFFSTENNFQPDKRATS